MEKLSEKFRCLDEYFEHPKDKIVNKCIKLAEAYEAEWEKRVAELEEAVTWRTSMMDQWQAQSEAQQKRITELERDFDMLTDSLQLAEAECDRLESQLAWTPVSDGLPTEPEFYLFLNSCREPSLFVCRGNGKFYEVDQEGSQLNAWTAEQMHYYTHFRRITLPE
jgi:hypothetical protein